MKYITATGQPFELLTRNIGRGGEGEVLPVVGNSALVAKIFHHPTLEHRAKLEFMVAHPAPQHGDHFWVTWPQDIIFTRNHSPKFAGYTMRKITNARPLFICYNPAVRRKKCLGFNYRYLVRCGRNLAAAFSQAHAHRYVIGDVNESNVFIRNDARATLIDADSWQVAVGSRIYRSCVAKSDFLPPELQGRNLKSLKRQPWHDNFSLAVLLFKITVEGTHAFDGVFHGAGDVPTLEARIAAGIFPYRDQSGRWSPKKFALPLFDSLHPRLQQLFVQAFVTGHARPQSRPDARTWQEAFTLAEGELQNCDQNSQHWFWGNQCVWCQRKILLGGQDPFPEIRPKTRNTVAMAVPTPPQAVLVSRAEPKALSVPANPKNPHSDLSEFHKLNIILAAVVIIMLAIFGSMMLLATVLRLVAQRFN